MSKETIFDKILNKKIPAQVVFENSHVLAFKDINPQSPIHVLVIPKKKVQQFSELSAQDPLYVGEFFRGVAQTAKTLGLEENGYRVIVNSGSDGQQTVDYLHAHIMGGRQLKWPPG